MNFTGNKWKDKLYRWHTGYPGGLKQRTASEMLIRKPEEILRKAILGMIPRNNLRHKYSAIEMVAVMITFFCTLSFERDTAKQLRNSSA